MRKSIVEACALAALLLGAALAWGDPPAAPDKDKPTDPPAKSKLEEMIEKALRDNPDVRLAAAKAAEAEADLSRARLLAVQKVASAYQAIEAQKAAVENAAAALEDVKKTAASLATAQSDQRAAEQKLIDAKAKLAQLEAELPYLLGQPPAADEHGRDIGFYAPSLDLIVRSPEFQRRLWLDVAGRLPTKEELASGSPPTPAVQGPAADRIRAALDKPFTLNAPHGSLNQMIDELDKAFQEGSQGLVIKNAAVADTSGYGNIPVHFDRLPLGAALEWVEDTLPNHRFVVRDYGLVFAIRDEAPPGAPLLADFWKGAKDADAGAPPAPTAGPPAVRFVAKVTAINVPADGRHTTIILKTFGDEALESGQTLEVYRINKADRQKDKYVGSIRLAGLTRDGVIATPVDKADVQPGDFAGVKIDAGDKNPPKSDAKDQGSGPPAKNVEGQVKAVDKDGRVHIDIGKKDGLTKGDVLTVLRIRPETEVPLYMFVGRIRVVDVGDGDAVAEPAEKANPVILPGDKVRVK